MKLSNIVPKFIQPIEKIKWRQEMIIPSQIIWSYNLQRYGLCSNPFSPSDYFKKYLFITVDNMGTVSVTYLTEEENEDPLAYLYDEDVALYEFEKETDKGLVYRLLKSKDS